MVEVGENKEVIERPDRPYQPRAQRWSGVKQTKHKKLAKVIGVEQNFNFMPYTFTPQDVVEIQLYTDLGESTVQLSNDEVQMKVLTWLAIISPTLLPFIAEAKTGTVNNPQRVMRQLGYDHSAVQSQRDGFKCINC